MTPGRINLSVADARDLAEGALRGIGFNDKEARIVADHVVEIQSTEASRRRMHRGIPLRSASHEGLVGDVLVDRGLLTLMADPPKPRRTPLWRRDRSKA